MEGCTNCIANRHFPSPRPHVCPSSLAHGTPDAVFPNNWFSTHPAGEALGGVQQDTLVFYPMKCPNRCVVRCARCVRVWRPATRALAFLVLRPLCPLCSSMLFTAR